MDSAGRRDWSTSGQDFLLLFAILPLFAFLLLRAWKHIAIGHRIVTGLMGLSLIVLAVAATSMFHIEYYEQTMIPVLAILYILTFAVLGSYSFAIMEKGLGRWKATKLIFLVVYLGYFLSLPSLFSSYRGGAAFFLAILGCGIAVIFDLVLEMRLKYGRGIAKTLAETAIAVILVWLMAVPMLYTMVMAFY